MAKKPKTYTPNFKFKVVMESMVKGNVAEVARQYQVLILTLFRQKISHKSRQFHRRDSFNKLIISSFFKVSVFSLTFTSTLFC